MAANSLCLNRFFVSLFKGNLLGAENTEQRCPHTKEVLYNMQVRDLSRFFHRIKELDEIIEVLVEMRKQLHRACCCHCTVS
jgi:hypothetical protein